MGGAETRWINVEKERRGATQKEERKLDWNKKKQLLGVQ
jgi:hypothetical protein